MRDRERVFVWVSVCKCWTCCVLCMRVGGGGGGGTGGGGCFV